MKMKLLLSLPVLAATALAANAQVIDNFESYALGSNLHGQGSWEGWDNTPSAGGFVSSDYAFSPTQSVKIFGDSDLVKKYSGLAGGQWTYTIKQYIPQNFTGQTYFILMNQYVSGPSGDKDWSVQINYDAATSKVTSESGGGATLPLIRGAWVDLRFDIDLAANKVTEFYNGALLSTHAWFGPDGGPTIQGMDLFANGASAVYYDDLAIRPVPEPGTMALLALGALGFVLRRRN